MSRELPSEEFVEQKITKQVTINAGITTTVKIPIPNNKKVFLKGSGYTWFASNNFTLSNGNTTFP